MEQGRRRSEAVLRISTELGDLAYPSAAEGGSEETRGRLGRSLDRFRVAARDPAVTPSMRVQVEETEEVLRGIVEKGIESRNSEAAQEWRAAVGLSLAGLRAEREMLDWQMNVERASFRRWLILLAACVFALASWGAFRLFTDVHRPAGRVASLASRIASGETDVRVPRLPGREWGAVARAMDALVGDLSATKRRFESESKVRELHLEQLVDDLRRANRLKSEFLANMSHELRTPLNAIVGYSALIRDEVYGPVTDKQKEALEKVRNSTQTLLRLINDVLDLSRLEAGRMPLQVERFDLRDLYRDAVGTFLPLAAEKKLNLRVEDLSDEVWVESDKGKIQQVIYNLLSNAIKFTPRGDVRMTTQLLNGTKPGAEWIQISVSDTGAGIRAEDQQAIFEEFTQVDSTATRSTGGSGLGLAIARKLMGVLGGSIAVRSEPGKGSEFTVRFPRVLEGASAAA